MNMDDEHLIVYINRSSYRVKIVQSLGRGYKIPTNIATDTGLLRNHISYVLSALARVGVVECVNPEYKKGRIYRLTKKGFEILDDVEYIPYMPYPKDDEEDSKSKKKKSKKKKSKKKKSTKKKSTKKKSKKNTKSAAKKSD